MIWPDYNQSILNLAASLLAHYGVRPGRACLDALRAPLAADHRHVALLVLDGLGDVSLEELLEPGDFLRAHRVCGISSVSPSTTAAAMTSYLTGLSPLEHGWLGWSCYLKEYARAVDLLLDRDSYSHRRLTPSPARALMPYSSIFSSIHAVRPDVLTRSVYPFPVPVMYGAQQALTVGSFDALCAALRENDQREQPSLTLAYWQEPDATMHQKGCNHPTVQALVRAINDELESTCRSLRDTLLIVSADHGLIDVTRDYWLSDQPDLAACLIQPPTIEPRCASVFVKSWRRVEFERAFEARMGGDFVLLSRQRVLDEGLLGPANASIHPKADDILGDYLAAAVGPARWAHQPVGAAPPSKHAARHGGLSEREMRVPLIVIGKEG